MRRKSSKNGESKWYLETANTNNNNNNGSSAISTPNIDRPSRKLGMIKKRRKDEVNCFCFHRLLFPASESSDELSKITPSLLLELILFA